jgi:hypothetical protein
VRVTQPVAQCQAGGSTPHQRPRRPKRPEKSTPKSSGLWSRRYGFESRRTHWPGSPSPIGGSGYSGELPLNLTVHGALKADEQLLIQHGSDPLQGRQLRDMRALLEPRHRAVRGPRSLGDLLLSQPQLEPPFTQMRSDRADFPQSTNAGVLSTGVTVCRAAVGATTRCLDSGTADRALDGIAHESYLITHDKSISLAGTSGEHPGQPPAEDDGAPRPSSPENRPCASWPSHGHAPAQRLCSSRKRGEGQPGCRIADRAAGSECAQNEPAAREALRRSAR